MEDLSKIRLYRLTHINNIPHVLQHGITHAHSPNANPNFVSIGDSSLISARRNFLLSNGRLLGDYTPFYFTYITRMLYKILNHFDSACRVAAADLVFCVSNVQKMIDSGLEFAFTDEHASNRLSRLYSREEVKKLSEIIDWKSVHAQYWKDEKDLDRKRKKEAEFLILGDIPLNYIGGFVVYSEQTKQRLIDMGANDAVIAVRPNYYFRQ